MLMCPYDAIASKICFNGCDFIGGLVVVMAKSIWALFGFIYPASSHLYNRWEILNNLPLPYIQYFKDVDTMFLVEFGVYSLDKLSVDPPMGTESCLGTCGTLCGVWTLVQWYLAISGHW